MVSMRSLILTALWVCASTALPQIQPEARNQTATAVRGPDKDGKYVLYGTNIRATFIPYGASISNLFINDTRGIERDVVAGFDNATYYGVDKQHNHFGGVPGRYANRIKNSSFVIDGETYNVTPNEHPTPDYPDGVNQLHGGPDGWDWRNWTVVTHTTNSITFSLTDPDGKEGFPGEVVSYVTYTLGDMTWDFKMVAIATTKKTPIMLSSHVSFHRGLPLNFANHRRHIGILMASPILKLLLLSTTHFGCRMQDREWTPIISSFPLAIFSRTSQEV